MNRVLWLVGCCVLALSAAGRPSGAEDVVRRPGEAFDAAPFGFPLREEDGKAVGVKWAEPRKIRRVVVDFGEGAEPPAPGAARLQYWHKTWDGRPDPVLAERGAAGLGWAAVDDWTNGNWKDADAVVEAAGRRWTYTFNPTGGKEFTKLGHPGVAFRRTLKVRVISDAPLPPGARLAALTDAVYLPLTVRVLWGAPADTTLRLGDGDEGRLEAFNGAVLAVRPVAGTSVAAGAAGAWSLPTGVEGGVEADLLMAVDTADARYDRTIVTVGSKRRPFSFAADEVARGDRILVDDLGALAVRGDDSVTLEGLRRSRLEFAGRTVYDRVSEQPEQSLSRSWKDMPLKHPLWFVHGLPGNRNAVRQDPNGEVAITAMRNWFKLPRSARDTERKGWAGEWLILSFGLPAETRRGGRELLQGYLPILRTWWQEGPLHYEQTCFLDTLDADLADVALDDPTLLWVRVRVVNTSGSEAATAGLRITSKTGAGREPLKLDDDRILGETPEGPRLRALRRMGGGTCAIEEGDMRWSLELPPGGAHEVFFLIPTVTLDAGEEVEALRGRDYEADRRRVAAYWEGLTARGAQIETPEPWLNDFYRAHVRHLIVNCYKEIGSDRLHAHVGTFRYGVFPDESAMMISDLDRRGYHREAERCLESFLHYQGTVQMPGNFKTKEGLFYGSGGHDHGGYNKSHGWVLWLMAEHWRVTRDRAWMERAAPKLVASCDWVTRERRATMTEAPDGSRPIEYGFLPTGSLEDVTDYWHWMVTNACTVWGFESLAEALADYGHPEAARLKAEAAAFREDVLRGLTESRVRAPVVRLRDGTYVPKYPSRLYERGRCHGWLRETLEGSIHLPITGLLAPDAPETRWIVKDFEDNLYISDAYGYSIPVFDRFWFSRGGFSMQANLLGGPLVYLYRDEVQHFLRTYFNSFTSAFDPEIRMCNEHSMPELGYPAGDHYKSSDEAQSTYWLRLMFVHERGGDLYLGQAIPREWLRDGRSVGIERAATHFGQVSLRIESHADQEQIRAKLMPPERNAPGTIYLRLRHPQGRPIQSVTVNGAPHERFDAKKEWIVLPGDVKGEQEVVARY